MTRADMQRRLLLMLSYLGFSLPKAFPAAFYVKPLKDRRCFSSPNFRKRASSYRDMYR